MKTALQATASSLFVFALIMLAMFWPAGTFDYWQAWVFLGVFVVLAVIYTIYMGVTNPVALRRRMNAGPSHETRPVQKAVSTGVGLTFFALLVAAGFDHRFEWSAVPPPLVLIGNVLVVVGLGIAMLVVVQNNYAAANITIEANQTVVSTGLYGLVRHPMYFGSLIMMVGTSLALGSYWGLVAVVVMACFSWFASSTRRRCLRTDCPATASTPTRCTHGWSPTSGEGETMKIGLQTLASTLFGIAFFAALLFWPAGTLDYWQAWVFIAVFITATMVPSIYLAVKNPAALRRRLKAGPTAETRPVQRFAIVGTAVSVVAVLVLSALDHRFGWSQVPTSVIVVGLVLVAVGLVFAQLVVIQNNYAAATITVEAEQKVVSTGLYGVVRHPMYVGALIMMAGTPLALDSYWGLVAIIPGLAVLALRILDEENMLTDELDGYREYLEKVHYRLVPYVW